MAGRKKPQGSVYLAKDRKFFTAQILYDDTDGKRRRKGITLETKGPDTRENRRKAEAELRKLLREYEAMGDLADGLFQDMTFAELFWTYLAGIENRIRKSTYEGYCGRARTILARAPFARKKVTEITKLEIRRFLDESVKELSAKSVREWRQLIHRAFEDAKDGRLIEVNPAEGITVRAPSGSRQKRADGYMEPEELSRFLAFVKENNRVLFEPCVLAGSLGLRRSEVLGMTRQAVDFEAMTLSVEATVVTINSTIAESMTKTDGSRRTLPMNEEIAAMLRELLNEQAKNKAFFGEEYYSGEGDDRLILWQDGRPLTGNFISRTVKKLFREFGRDDMNFHGLRGSLSSAMVTQGADILTVSKVLGHSNPGTLMKHYLKGTVPKDISVEGLKI